MKKEVAGETAKRIEAETRKAWEDMKKEVTEETAKRVREETAKRVEAETKDSTLLENLRTMMETPHLSADQAMAALKVPESKRTTFSAML